MFLFPRKGCVLAAALLLGALVSQAQPFTNGGFEIITGPPIGSNSSQTLNPGDAWLTGWSSGGPDGAVQVQNGSVGMQQGSVFFGLSPFEGAQWVLFPDDVPGGSIAQTFSTTVGGYYTVTFAGGYVYTADAPLLGVTVTASDNTILSNNLYAVSFRQWASFQLAFIATTPTTTLTFYDGSADAEGADIGLDAVTLVGEPPGWPYIISSPQSETNGAGTLATFSASAGGAPSTVQWYLGANAVPDATNTLLTVVSGAATAGSYTAVFSNAAGTNSTTPALLTVLYIVTAPTNQTASNGASATFMASASLTNATVQWYLDGNMVPGGTMTTLTVTAGSQTAGDYTAQFALGMITVTSAPATLTVLGATFGNGSFENTAVDIPPGGDQVGNPGDQWLTGWAFGGCTNGVFVFDGEFFGFNAEDGSKWVVFDSQNAPPGGSVYQTFSTTAGQSYTATFFALAIPYENDTAKSLTASALASDGATLASVSVSPPESWSSNQLVFIARDTNTTLVFTDSSAPNVGPSVGLDNVSVFLTGYVPPPPPAPPALTVVSFQPMAGFFVVGLAGQTNQTYIMQTSTNLLAWQSVSTNLLSVSPVNITNAVIPGAAAQFWRVVPGP